LHRRPAVRKKQWLDEWLATVVAWFFVIGIMVAFIAAALGPPQ
jgi:hypothetical protein